MKYLSGSLFIQHKYRFVKFVLSVLVLSLISSFGLAQKEYCKIEKRGIVLYPSDLISVGADTWVNFLEQGHLNLLGIHTDSRFERLPDLKRYLESEDGRKLFRLCADKGIDIEFELHVLQDLLPRKVFSKHPEYFRMDKNGVRQQEHNMCFTSEKAYKIVEKNILELVSWLKPTTHRYFFWTDDYADAFCHCKNCRKYSPSEQALIYENHVLKILRKADPKATLSHLSYSNTLDAPKNVKPSKGIFLEYAPISRNYAEPLTVAHIDHLKNNLEVFPKETAHILEYWLDASMASGWKKNQLIRLPWRKEQCHRDVILYKSLGICSITTFGAWINRDYLNQFGESETEQVIKEYGDILNE